MIVSCLLVLSAVLAFGGEPYFGLLAAYAAIITLAIEQEKQKQ